MLRIIQPGMHSTIQDLGRPGMSGMGVPRGGAADTISVRLGNRLVGNDERAAVVEMTLVGGEFEFESPARVCLSGARVHASIRSPDSSPRPFLGWSAEHCLAGDLLRVGPIERGCRVYLCIRGGLSVTPVLGSRATLVSGGFGGLGGRPLLAGDRVEVGGHAETAVSLRLSESGAALIHEILTRRTLRAVVGTHWGHFDRAARERFATGEYTIGARSDRVGLRMAGQSIAPPFAGRMTSEGMMWGAVQVPEGGDPLVLMCDHPTTGGYPVIACVASVDLPVLGQLRPGDRVRFEYLELDAARSEWRKQEDRLAKGVAGA